MSAVSAKRIKGKKDKGKNIQSKELSAKVPKAPKAPKEEEIIELPKNSVICARWKVANKLGAGGCGAVYKVEDLFSKGTFRAIKVEAASMGPLSVLKLEKKVLEGLSTVSNTLRMYDCGRKATFSFIVMSLCGSDLLNIAAKIKSKFSPASLSKIGIMCLSAIKHVHDIGYVHRDVKPGNLVFSSPNPGRDARVLWLIDFGLVRCYVDTKDRSKVRKKRQKVQFRGTLRYCSLNAHLRMEQGRVDDLFSLMYVLQAIVGGLPWDGFTKEDEIIDLKRNLDDQRVFVNSPPEFPQICNYLRKISSEERPDYQLVRKHFLEQVTRDKSTFLDPFEWEKEADVMTCIEATDDERTTFQTESNETLQYRMYPMVAPSFFDPAQP